jgi:hypothetical protein
VPLNDHQHYDLLISPDWIDMKEWILVEGTSEIFKKKN